MALMPLLPVTLGLRLRGMPKPPQVMSPNEGEELIHETMPAARPSQDDESQPRIKEERKEEEVTPKSEAATVGTKDEPAEHDSQDSFRPEHVAEELQRLIAKFPRAKPGRFGSLAFAMKIRHFRGERS